MSTEDTAFLAPFLKVTSTSDQWEKSIRLHLLIWHLRAFPNFDGAQEEALRCRVFCVSSEIADRAWLSARPNPKAIQQMRMAVCGPKEGVCGAAEKRLDLPLNGSRTPVVAPQPQSKESSFTVSLFEGLSAAESNRKMAANIRSLPIAQITA